MTLFRVRRPASKRRLQLHRHRRPGEGDASQYSLVERYSISAGATTSSFSSISSDVIYPAGAMTDYENNFYLPFKGFTKPIYAIPGNHDWFDALEGFNANFLEPKAARAALAARVAADLNLTSTDKSRIDALSETRRSSCATLYGIPNANQRGPFFELQTNDFALDRDRYRHSPHGGRAATRLDRRRAQARVGQVHAWRSSVIRNMPRARTPARATTISLRSTPCSSARACG